MYFVIIFFFQIMLHKSYCKLGYSYQGKLGQSYQGVSRQARIKAKFRLPFKLYAIVFALKNDK